MGRPRTSAIWTAMRIRWRRRVRTRERVLYLTFDDGPIPEVTPWVLDTLKEHNAKATFFCLGRNIERDPGTFARIKAEGHGLGNHTWSHLDGWESDRLAYVRDTVRCQALTRTALFRPPYGRVTLGQAATLGRRLELVFWDVMSHDFDGRVSAQQCLQGVIRRSRPGSILVFHDSLLAEEHVRYALPRLLRHFAGEGYRFDVLPGGTTAIPASRQASMPPSSSTTTV